MQVLWSHCNLWNNLCTWSQRHPSKITHAVFRKKLLAHDMKNICPKKPLFIRLHLQIPSLKRVAEVLFTVCYVCTIVQFALSLTDDRKANHNPDKRWERAEAQEDVWRCHVRLLDQDDVGIHPIRLREVHCLLPRLGYGDGSHHKVYFLRNKLMANIIVEYVVIKQKRVRLFQLHHEYNYCLWGIYQMDGFDGIFTGIQRLMDTILINVSLEQKHLDRNCSFRCR